MAELLIQYATFYLVTYLLFFFFFTCSKKYVPLISPLQCLQFVHRNLDSLHTFSLFTHYFFVVVVHSLKKVSSCLYSCSKKYAHTLPSKRCETNDRKRVKIKISKAFFFLCLYSPSKKYLHTLPSKDSETYDRKRDVRVTAPHLLNLFETHGSLFIWIQTRGSEVYESNCETVNPASTQRAARVFLSSLCHILSKVFVLTLGSHNAYLERPQKG